MVIPRLLLLTLSQVSNLASFCPLHSQRSALACYLGIAFNAIVYLKNVIQFSILASQSGANALLLPRVTFVGVKHGY